MECKHASFPMVRLTMFVSSLQQSAFLDVMKNTVSVINQESASKSRKAFLSLHKLILQCFNIFSSVTISVK